MKDTGLRGEELAHATLDYIREHPESWCQDEYICETTACFAGRAVLLAGGRRPRGERTSDVAMRLLGWSAEEAFSVFHLFTDDFSELEAAVKEVLSGQLREGTGLGRLEALMFLPWPEEVGECRT